MGILRVYMRVAYRYCAIMIPHNSRSLSFDDSMYLPIHGPYLYFHFAILL